MTKRSVRAASLLFAHAWFLSVRAARGRCIADGRSCNVIGRYAGALHVRPTHPHSKKPPATTPHPEEPPTQPHGEWRFVRSAPRHASPRVCADERLLRAQVMATLCAQMNYCSCAVKRVLRAEMICLAEEKMGAHSRG